MHIEESATQQLKLQLLPLSAQSPVDKEQLENCQRWQAALQMALTSGGLSLWDWNLVSDKIYCDPQCQRILGYELEEIDNYHQSFLALVHPQDLPCLRSLLNEYLQGKRLVYEVEFRMLAKSGEWKWILAQGAVFQRDKFGKPVQMIGTYKDITTEKLAALANKQQQLRQRLLNAVASGIHSISRRSSVLQTVVDEVQGFFSAEKTVIYQFGADNSGVVVFESVANNAQTNSIHKFDVALTANLAIPILLSQEVEASSNRVWGLLIVYACDSFHQWQTGEIESLKELSKIIAIALQQWELFHQVQNEIALRQFVEAQEREKSIQLENTLKELKNVQQQVLQNQKMANLGQMVAQITNEINNPVNFIYGNLHPASEYAEELIRLVELFQHHYPTPPPVIASQIQRLDLDFIKTDLLKILWSMRAGSERIKEIVLALGNFSGLDEKQKRKINLHEGLDSVLRILQHRLKQQPDRPKIEVIKNFGELPLIKCYPGELNQVFMNILTNAIDALEEKLKQDNSFIPKIWINTEIVSSHLWLVSSNEPRKNDKKLAKKQNIVIRITDNGKGILPHIKRRIFDPFFTTKPLGKGKGLGLSISEEIIVQNHQGRLKCNSQLGEGTELIIEMNATAARYVDIRKHATF